MSHVVARSPEPTAARDSRRDTHAALADLPREHGFEPLAVDGRVPAELRGTLYRNGATLMSAGGRRYDHWFDGDGGLSAVRFDAGTVTGAARVIQSAGLVEERAAGKLLYGGFGTVQPGLLRRLRGSIKNTANTSVMWWQERLFALMEAALPTEMDPDTLATLGERDLGGVVPRTFSAHPHRIPARRAAYNFGVRYGRRTVLDLFELPDQGPARRIATLPLPGPTLIHDFIATENHLIFFVPPLRLRVARMFLGLGGFSDNLAWRPELGTEVLVVPIDDPGRPIRFTAEPFFTWHYANAFERGRELVVNYVRYPDFASNRWIGEMFRGQKSSGGSADGTFHRAVIDVNARRLTSEERWSRPCEFPRVAPAALATSNRFAYVAAHSAGSDGRGLQDAIARIEIDTGRVSEYVLEPGRYTAEPVFVPRPGAGAEDDGYLLALVYDATDHTSACTILDARDLEAGPLARAQFDHHIPPRFHGIWVG